MAVRPPLSLAAIKGRHADPSIMKSGEMALFFTSCNIQDSRALQLAWAAHPADMGVVESESCLCSLLVLTLDELMGLYWRALPAGGCRRAGRQTS